MSTARRHDPEASRAAILAAAETRFLDKGFAGTSMSEIAKASGVTKSLIHHHFGSKEALWGEVKRRRFGDWHRQQMQLLSTEELTQELLRKSMEVYFLFLLDNPATLRLMSWLQLEEDQDIRDLVEEMRDAGIKRIEDAQKAGIVREDVPAPFVLVAFLGVVQAWFAEGRPDGETEPNRRDAALKYFDSAWTIFSTGISATRSMAR